MKTIFALVLVIGSMASAVSLKPYDRWTCSFPYTTPGSMIQGANVSINFDMRTFKGTATQYATCINCRVQPQTIAIERVSLRSMIIYKNDNANFIMHIITKPVAPQGGVYEAVLANKVSGTCTAQ